jgi:hypothetical protein
MKRNSRSVRQKVAAAIAMLLVLGGGAIAAVSATGADRPKGAQRTRHGAGGIRHRDLPAAASYLGLSPAQLEAELRSGRSLAQIAESTPGRSGAGLIDALVARKRERLSKLAATLPQRVRAEVDRQGGLAGALGARRAGGSRNLAHRGLGAAAAAYLGISVRQLRARLHAGRTLAEIASATPGRSPAGLIDALIAAKKRRIAARTAAGRLTPSQADRANGRAEKVITKTVNRRSHPRHHRLVRR